MNAGQAAPRSSSCQPGKSSQRPACKGFAGGGKGSLPTHCWHCGQGGQAAGSAVLRLGVNWQAVRRKLVNSTSMVRNVWLCDMLWLDSKIYAIVPATMLDTPSLERLLCRAEAVLGRLEAFLPPPPAAPDWQSARAWRWRKANGRGWLQPVARPHTIRLADLDCIDEQKERVLANTCLLYTSRCV